MSLEDIAKMQPSYFRRSQQAERKSAGDDGTQTARASQQRGHTRAKTPAKNAKTKAKRGMRVLSPPAYVSAYSKGADPAPKKRRAALKK